MPRLTNGVIDTDLPCHHCGFNLRTHHLRDRCPECGTPVRNSIHGDNLCFADPDFLRSVIRGASVITWSALLLVVTCLLNTFTGLPILEYSSLFIVGLALYGVFLLTTPDPASTSEASYARFRTPARVLLSIGPVFAILQRIQESPAMSRDPILGPLFHPLIFLTCAAGVIGFVFLAMYLRGLAWRVNSNHLVDHFLYCAIILAGSIVLLALEQLFLQKLPGPTRVQNLIACAAVIPFFALIGSCIRMTLGIRRLGKLVRLSLSFAEQFAKATN
jgi:hypothetical protein